VIVITPLRGRGIALMEGRRARGREIYRNAAELGASSRARSLRATVSEVLKLMSKARACAV
jgi:hypothetical protein